MKRRVVLVSCLLAGALAACDAPKQARQEAPPRPVLVAAVHYQPRERAQALPGVVKARTESELAFRVGGRLEVRLVDSGAFVRKARRSPSSTEATFSSSSNRRKPSWPPLARRSFSPRPRRSASLR